MSTSDLSPPLVPDHQAVFIVLDDFGPLGRAWREVDEEDADLEGVLTNFFTGQYRDPVQVVAFNAGEGWSRDVSADIAQTIRRAYGQRGEGLPDFLRDFVDQHDPGGDAQLPLPLIRRSQS